MKSEAPSDKPGEHELLDRREYVGIEEISGPIIAISGIHHVGYNELVEVVDGRGNLRLGMTLEVSTGAAIVQVFEGTSGLKLGTTKVRFTGKPLMMPLSPEVLGRVFDGLGRPVDGGPDPIGERRDVNGLPVNPTAREYPRQFIQTGISAIDGMNTLVRGQKLPVFSGSGLPHMQIVAQITRQAQIVGEDTGFAVVFAGMGIKHDEERSGSLTSSSYLKVFTPPSVRART